MYYKGEKSTENWESLHNPKKSERQWENYFTELTNAGKIAESYTMVTESIFYEWEIKLSFINLYEKILLLLYNVWEFLGDKLSRVDE